MREQVRYVVKIKAGFVAALMMYPRHGGTMPAVLASLPRLELATTGTPVQAMRFASRESASDLRDMIYRHAAQPGEVIEVPEPAGCVQPSPLDTYAAKYAAKALEPVPRRCATCKHELVESSNPPCSTCCVYPGLPRWEDRRHA